MSDYRVVAERSRKALREAFYVSIVAANGEKLFTSETLRDRSYALELARKFAAMLDGNLIDAT